MLVAGDSEGDPGAGGGRVPLIMKLLMLCAACGLVGDNVAELLNYVELRDDAYYEVECSRGHRRSVVLTQEKFAILFESGAMALLDGYTREAVSSFAAAPERFYEYWIRAVLLASGTSPEVLDTCWKLVIRQSERQYGAFCLLYQREYGRVPAVLSQQHTEFRNGVVHRGYIPTRDEVVVYASDVLKIVIDLYWEQYETRYKGVSNLTGLEIWKARQRAPNGVDLSTMSIATMFSDVAASKGLTSFEAALALLAQRRERRYSR
jgi:hypothetical protein